MKKFKDDLQREFYIQMTKSYEIRRIDKRIKIQTNVCLCIDK